MIALICDHLWQSTAFTGCAALLAWMFRHNGANVRFWLWFSASVKFLLPFAILVTLGNYLLIPITPRLHAPAVMLMEPVAQPFSGPEPALTAPGSAATSASTHVDLTLLLLGLWAAGFAAYSIRWLVRWSKLRELLRAAADLPLSAPIAVKSSPSWIEPGLVGIFQPAILLPAGIEQHLTPAEMNTILAHELCHWRRRDNLLAAIHMFVEALFWFFPLVWWLGTRLDAERERACDEGVLAAGGDPATYVEGILQVCRLYHQSPLSCAAGVSGGVLRERLDLIIENRLLARLNGFKKSLLATCAATAIIAPLSLGLLTASLAESPAIAAQTDRPHPGTEAALRRQIEGWERKRPALDDLTPSVASLVKQQQAVEQLEIDGLGALKKITFKENAAGSDVYQVEFEHGVSAWTIAPLADGKISSLAFQLAEKRIDKGPSPGVEVAMRRNYAGLLNRTPAYDFMGTALLNATSQQHADLELDAKNLGPLKSLTFVKIDARGWDVYAITFENGTATWKASPLVDGKLQNLLWSDIRLPKAPAHPGTQASLRLYIESLEKGQPNYDDMTPGMAAAVKRQLPEILAWVKSWGALKSIAFRGGAVEAWISMTLPLSMARLNGELDHSPPMAKSSIEGSIR